MSGDGAAAAGGEAAATLLKMLAAERRRDFDDGAVAGGLDAYLRGALAQAAGDSPLYGAVAALPKAGYASLSAAERSAWARRARALLRREEDGADRRGRGRAQGSAAGKRSRPGRPEGPGARRAEGERRSRVGAGLAAPVGSLDRIRATTVAKLERIGVRTVGEMLWHFPHRHADFRDVKPIAALMVGESATVVGRVRNARVAFVGRRMRSTEATIEDESGRIRALWFNQPYLAKQLPQGARVGLAGKVSAYRGRLQFESPEWEPLDEDDPLGAAPAGTGGTHVGRYVPIYPLTQGLPGRTVRRLARAAIERCLPLVAESLPPEVLAETGYLSEQEAIAQLHFPASLAQRDAARERLAFQELLAIQLAVLRRKREQRERADAPIVRLSGEFLQSFVEALPFQLTGAQMRTVTQIRQDLDQPEPMARLLQGDVGSGKTVVAAAAMLGAVATGQQAVLMAPTEILAEQHFQTFSRIFGGEGESVFHNYNVAPALGRPVRMELLSGSVSAARKRAIRRGVETGEVDIVVGTHALIEQRVAFARLALAVVDEQHRFGVLQRDALRGKGGSPHLLVMTATPIPRTLALTIYGDLDVSRLDELPPGRRAVETKYAGPEEREAVYGRVREEIAKGRQAFIICPLVEESDAVEAKAAVQEFERLRAAVFPELAERMRLLHGRMAAGEKEAAMEDFRTGRADLLVSTAVVEVGVDVPNASVIVIEGAERFGLAQLHQFRGRVGRSQHQSYCLLLSGSDVEGAKARLSLLESTSDGFALAGADLRLRGPGEYFGTRQSGLPDLRVARLTDQDLLLRARNFAVRILERDPNLRAPEHQPLARAAGQLSVAGAEAVH